MNEMFSIDDTIDTGEPIELDLSNYSELGHKHNIVDINNLEERLEDIESKLTQLTSLIDSLTDSSASSKINSGK